MQSKMACIYLIGIEPAQYLLLKAIVMNMDLLCLPSSMRTTPEVLQDER